MISTRFGLDLSEEELKQINSALFREFKAHPLSETDLNRKIFFLLKRGTQILALGSLMDVVIQFNNEEFQLKGITNIISNEKGKGYGKQVVIAIRNYLVANDISGLGFCFPKNRGFYEKCGFKVVDHITQRFVYEEGHKRITNQDGQIIFYQDSSDKFMEKVTAHPDKDAQIPTQHLW